jgi:hypothetical protein
MYSPAPPFTPLEKLCASIKEGFAIIAPNDFEQLSKHPLADWNKLQTYWSDLPPDQYLKDGGRYRKRRHSSIILRDHLIEIAPHRPHWQPLSYNALHGGINRHFEPCESSFLEDSAFHQLLIELGAVFSKTKELTPSTPWFIEAHQFRIDTKDGIGRPTPEGAHRDGVDFVAILLVDRQAIKGGESRIFLNDQPMGQRFTLITPWSLVLLDDAKVIHETTPIQPKNSLEPEKTWRDTLVLTYRLNNFQDKTD